MLQSGDELYDEMIDSWDLHHARAKARKGPGPSPSRRCRRRVLLPAYSVQPPKPQPMSAIDTVGSSAVSTAAFGLKKAG